MRKAPIKPVRRQVGFGQARRAQQDLINHYQQMERMTNDPPQIVRQDSQDSSFERDNNIEGLQRLVMGHDFEKLPECKGSPMMGSCAICLSEYKQKQILKILPCTHKYHSKCIQQWLTKSQTNSCPLCKNKIF